jgi:hypothetical protein
VAVLVEFWVIFAVGAYDEWRSADRAIAEVLLPSFDATIRQLEGERGRANLRHAEGDPSDSDIHNIDWLFDGFWLQTLEILSASIGRSATPYNASTRSSPIFVRHGNC